MIVRPPYEFCPCVSACPARRCDLHLPSFASSVLPLAYPFVPLDPSYYATIYC